MHVERDFKLVIAAMRAFPTQMSDGFGARIASTLLAFDFETLAASVFVIDKFLGVGCAAFETQKRGLRLNFKIEPLQRAPYIGLRTSNFFGDLRTTQAARH